MAALVVALVAGAGGLAACSGSSGDGSSAASAPTSAPTTTTSLPKPVAYRAGDQTFYDVPQPLPAAWARAPHGTLVRSQPIPAYRIPGATAHRILYTSRSLAGKPIVVSGVGLVPTAAAPEGGRPMITITHGTTGIADECAPSKHPLVGETTLVGRSLGSRFLVAATDYEGLGTPGRHPYLVGQSEGRSAIDALLAVGQLPNAHPGTRFAVAGYSQGGHGAIWTSQVARDWAPDLQVVGTFAGAPASEIDVLLAAAPVLPQAGFAYMVVAGFEAAYPEAKADTFLTPKGVGLLDAVDHGCAQNTFKAVAGIPPRELIRPGAADSAPWKALARANDAGTEKTNDAPTLIIHSTGDGTVPLAFSELLLARMCKEGQVVERRLIDAGGHVSAAVPAYQQAMRWIEQRFEANPPAPTNSCPQT